MKNVFSFATLLACIVLAQGGVAFGQGTGGPGPPPEPPPSVITMECPLLSPFGTYTSITVTGRAPEGTETVEVVMMTTVGGCGGTGAIIGIVTANVDPVTHNWEATFTQGVNAFNGWICDDDKFDLGEYSFVAGPACCTITLNIECYYEACCYWCVWEEYCSGYCDAYGIIPSDPICDLWN